MCGSKQRCACGSPKDSSAAKCRSCYNAERSERAKNRVKQTCSKCKVPKVLVDFPTDNRLPNGRKGVCRDCANGHIKSLGHISQKKYRLKTQYGITLEQYDQMYENQCKSCAGCNTPIEKWGRSTHVDHDHETGKVRGILCQDCNSVLGYARDSIERLTCLIEYLKNSESASNTNESEIMTTKDEIMNWLKEGKVAGATHMLVICDTFDWEDYPVYVKTIEDVNKKIAEYSDPNKMQKIMEVYSYALDLEAQLKEHRSYHV